MFADIGTATIHWSGVGICEINEIKSESTHDLFKEENLHEGDIF